MAYDGIANAMALASVREKFQAGGDIHDVWQGATSGAWCRTCHKLWMSPLFRSTTLLRHRNVLRTDLWI